jgi:hypothetical protein
MPHMCREAQLTSDIWHEPRENQQVRMLPAGRSGAEGVTTAPHLSCSSPPSWQMTRQHIYTRQLAMAVLADVSLRSSLTTQGPPNPSDHPPT